MPHRMTYALCACLDHTPLQPTISNVAYAPQDRIAYQIKPPCPSYVHQTPTPRLGRQLACRAKQDRLLLHRAATYALPQHHLHSPTSPAPFAQPAACALGQRRRNCAHPGRIRPTERRSARFAAMARTLCSQEALPVPLAPTETMQHRLQTPRRPASAFVWVDFMLHFHDRYTLLLNFI